MRDSGAEYSATFSLSANAPSPRSCVCQGGEARAWDQGTAQPGWLGVVRGG